MVYGNVCELSLGWCNVYGMGLFSDGGIFATKPYICGSSYFMKMMDFKKGIGVTRWMDCTGDLSINRCS